MNELIPQSVEQKAAETESLAEEFQGFKIVTAEGYGGAADQLKAIKSKTKELDELRKSLTKPLDESKKRIMEFFKKPLAFLAMAEASIKSAILKWQEEQESIRRAEEDKIRKAQQKEAEELQRRAREEEEKANRFKTEKAKEAAQARAEELKAKAAQTAAVVPVVQSKVEKVAGIATKTIWKFRITDLSQLPKEYMLPNEKLLGEVARSTKGSLEVPGIEFYSENILAAGR